MTDAENRQRFRRLPDRIRLEDAVETIDVNTPHPLSDEHEDRVRMLRDAGGASV